MRMQFYNSDERNALLPLLSRVCENCSSIVPALFLGDIALPPRAIKLFYAFLLFIGIVKHLIPPLPLTNSEPSITIINFSSVDIQ